MRHDVLWISRMVVPRKCERSVPSGMLDATMLNTNDLVREKRDEKMRTRSQGKSLFETVELHASGKGGRVRVCRGSRPHAVDLCHPWICFHHITPPVVFASKHHVIAFNSSLPLHHNPEAVQDGCVGPPFRRGFRRRRIQAFR